MKDFFLNSLFPVMLGYALGQFHARRGFVSDAIARWWLGIPHPWRQASESHTGQKSPAKEDFTR